MYVHMFYPQIVFMIKKKLNGSSGFIFFSIKCNLLYK